MTIDELHGIFTAYEMRIGQDGTSKKDTAFKIQSEDLDDEESLFIKKLERGTGRYKGKLALKCFNYGRIGHFSHKCSYPKQEESDHEESFCHKGKNKFKGKRKNFYSKKESEDEEMSEDNEIMFLGTTNSYEES